MKATAKNQHTGTQSPPLRTSCKDLLSSLLVQGLHSAMTWWAMFPRTPSCSHPPIPSLNRWTRISSLIDRICAHLTAACWPEHPPACSWIMSVAQLTLTRPLHKRSTLGKLHCHPGHLIHQIEWCLRWQWQSLKQWNQLPTLLGKRDGQMCG